MVEFNVGVSFGSKETYEVTLTYDGNILQFFLGFKAIRKYWKKNCKHILEANRPIYDPTATQMIRDEEKYTTIYTKIYNNLYKNMQQFIQKLHRFENCDKSECNDNKHVWEVW